MPVVKQQIRTAVWPCLLLISVSASVHAASVTPPSSSCIEEAWQFACAISNDANDRAACQAKTARAWLDAADPARAVRAASEIQDWRGLAVIADAASWWAARGQTNEAMSALLEAQHRAPGVKDWPYDRLQMHLARAKALLGMKADLDLLAQVYRDNRDYAGAVQAARALEAVRRGSVEEALAHLDQISKQQHLDLLSARAAGFREMAASDQLSVEKASQLLKLAWDSAAAVPGWRKFDLQFELIDSLGGTKLEPQTREYLTTLTGNLKTDPLPDHIRATRLAEAAVRWGRLGETQMVAQLGARAVELMRASMELIERPALIARLAEAHAAAGEKEKAGTLLGEALDVAAGLLNARPRAIAALDVALSQARCGVDSKTFADKRHAMLEGLGVRVR
jgi:hypothetical protein